MKRAQFKDKLHVLYTKTCYSTSHRLSSAGGQVAPPQSQKQDQITLSESEPGQLKDHMLNWSSISMWLTSCHNPREGPWAPWSNIHYPSSTVAALGCPSRMKPSASSICTHLVHYSWAKNHPSLHLLPSCSTTLYTPPFAITFSAHLKTRFHIYAYSFCSCVLLCRHSP